MLVFKIRCSWLLEKHSYIMLHLHTTPSIYMVLLSSHKYLWIIHARRYYIKNTIFHRTYIFVYPFSMRGNIYGRQNIIKS